MSTNVIIGTDVIIDFYKVNDYYPGICAENVSMTKTAVPKSVKTIGDGVNAAYRLQSKGYTFTIDGIIPYDGSASEVTAFDLLDRYENMLAVPFRMTWQKPDGTYVKAIYGNAFITEITFTGPNDFAGASVSFLGTGPTENFDGLTACDAVIGTLTLQSQTDTTATFAYTGATLATRFDYTIEGTVNGIIFVNSTVFTPALPSGTFTVSPIIPNGGHTIRVTPICSNGEPGAIKSLSYTKT